MSGSSEYVLLGVADYEVSDTSAVTWECNKIGGEPDWLSESKVPICEKCKREQLLIVQIYCPLDGSEYHRTLHVFTCKNPHCWSSGDGWTVIRSQVKPRSLARETNKVSDQPMDDWGADDDDWGIDDGWGATSIIDKINTMSISNTNTEANHRDVGNYYESEVQPSATNPSNKSSTEALKCFFINVFNEADVYENVHSSDQHVKKLVDEYNKENEQTDLEYFDGKIKLKSEEYEKNQIESDVFHQFWKNIRKCYQQVIRYNHNGTPLLVKEIKSMKLPRCQNCHRNLIFELQLMPALLPYLSNDALYCHIEFGTILIYTCESNCFSTSPVKEHVVYQPDPDLLYFKGQNINE